MASGTIVGTIPAEYKPDSEMSSGNPPRSPKVNLFKIDFFLRLLTFVATLVGIIVELTSKQTEVVGMDPITGLPLRRSAKYNDSPAFIYLLSALVATCFYSIITLVVSISNIRKPSPPSSVLFHLIIIDVVMAGVMATASGAAAGVAYIGMKGNSNAGWGKICHIYGKYCGHNGGALSVGLAAATNLLLLVIISSYSLKRRCH